MLRIGAHISSARGFLEMGRHALRLGANTFAFFTRNPRGSGAKEIDSQDVAAFRGLAAAHGFAPVVAHAPYTMNPCSAKERVREFAHIAFEDDMRRMLNLPGAFYNLHPGSHMGQGSEVGASLTADMLRALQKRDQPTTVLLETMSGKGSELGGSFEELRMIFERLDWREPLGVCLDTCHVWDAGYDIVSNLDGVLEDFDRQIGLARLRAVHLNDSLNPRGSRKDRHARLGEGTLGRDFFVRLTNHPALRGRVFILETPNDDAGWAEEIAFLRANYHP